MGSFVPPHPEGFSNRERTSPRNAPWVVDQNLYGPESIKLCAAFSLKITNWRAQSLLVTEGLSVFFNSRVLLTVNHLHPQRHQLQLHRPLLLLIFFLLWNLLTLKNS